MRWTTKIFVSIIVLAALVYGGGILFYYLSDDLDDYLTSNGFQPLHPPRDGVRLGSLYDLDPSGYADILCPTTEGMVAGLINPGVGYSRSDIEAQGSGTFSLISDISDRLRGKLGSDYKKRIKLKLQAIKVQEIPAVDDAKIQADLLSKTWCARTVHDRLRAGRYVCQLQSVFRASAIYEVNAEMSGAIGGSASKDNVPESLKTAVAEAVQTTTSSNVSTAGNSISVGSDLVFGTRPDPICVTPDGALFARIWPRTAVERRLNFLKYNVIEPIVSMLMGSGAGGKQ